MPAGMNKRGRTIAGHFAGGFANDVGLNTRFGISPLGREIRDPGGKLLEAEAVSRYVFLVVEILAQQDIHPRQEKSDVGAGFDGQVPLGLAGGDGKTRIHHDEARTGGHRLRKLLHLRVVHVLTKVRADENDAARVGNVGALGRTDVFAEGEPESHVARAAALSKGGSGDVRCAVGP